MSLPVRDNLLKNLDGFGVDGANQNIFLLVEQIGEYVIGNRLRVAAISEMFSRNVLMLSIAIADENIFACDGRNCFMLNFRGGRGFGEKNFSLIGEEPNGREIVKRSINRVFGNINVVDTPHIRKARRLRVGFVVQIIDFVFKLDKRFDVTNFLKKAKNVHVVSILSESLAGSAVSELNRGIGSLKVVDKTVGLEFAVSRDLELLVAELHEQKI